MDGGGYAMRVLVSSGSCSSQRVFNKFDEPVRFTFKFNSITDWCGINQKIISFLVSFTHTHAGWKQLLLSSAFVGTAMLCKEQGITVTGICAIYEIFVAQKVNILFHISDIIIFRSCCCCCSSSSPSTAAAPPTD